jgi:hypothetical protein
VEFGLLWYDDSPGRDLVEKVRRAVAHYEHKFGQAPTLCFVNPRMLDGAGGKLIDMAPVQVEARPTVLPHHFLVGVASGNGHRNGRKSRRSAG